MRKFSVLHLSDLHIQKIRSTYPVTLSRLITDVKEETANIDSLILIVTGDIIDKADFDESSDVAIAFFDDLCNKLKGKIKRIFFTPGNHDKKRLENPSLMRRYFEGKAYEDLYNKFDKGDWKNLFSHSFDNYIELIENIAKKTKIDIRTDLFYCDIFEVDDCIVRINSINSSLTSFDDNDYGTLHVGKFQIDKIEQDYEKNKGLFTREPDVSITIMHHPTFWLCKEEYDDVMYSVSSHDSLATDVLLRGHTHNRSLENYYSLYSSFSTFVTGIGKIEKPDSDHPQRYSIYTFMCDLNLIEIVMKSSSEKGFIPDYSAYVSETDESRKKIHFPMHVHDFISDTYLRIPLINNDFQPIFPSKSVFERIHTYTGKLLDLKERLTNILFLHKMSFLAELKDENCEEIQNIEDYLLRQGYNDTLEQKNAKVELILNEHKERVIEIVKVLLYDFCTNIIGVFFEGILKKDEEVRVQFRVINKKEFSHEGLTNVALKGSGPQAPKNITSVPWKNGLIEKSFNKKVPLIYSLNKKQVDDRINETNWKDYFTYSPNMATNIFYNKKQKKNYPIISFGINCDFPSCYAILEVLSLMPFQSIIDDFLLDIHNSFNFSFESLIKKK